jgi:hypothetical protein
VGAFIEVPLHTHLVKTIASEGYKKCAMPMVGTGRALYSFVNHIHGSCSTIPHRRIEWKGSVRAATNYPRLRSAKERR